MHEAIKYNEIVIMRKRGADKEILLTEYRVKFQLKTDYGYILCFDKTTQTTQEAPTYLHKNRNMLL